MFRPLAAAALLLIPAAAVAQGPLPGPYLAPNPYGPAAPFGVPGPLPAFGGPLGFGPDAYPFNPPAYARPSRYATPPRSRFGGALAALVLSPRAGVFAPGPSQSTIYRPNPFAPPLRLEPVPQEATVGRVRARRYDYSFDAVPLTNGAAPPRVW